MKGDELFLFALRNAVIRFNNLHQHIGSVIKRMRIQIFSYLISEILNRIVYDILLCRSLLNSIRYIIVSADNSADLLRAKIGCTESIFYNIALIIYCIQKKSSCRFLFIMLNQAFPHDIDIRRHIQFVYQTYLPSHAPEKHWQNGGKTEANTFSSKSFILEM